MSQTVTYSAICFVLSGTDFVAKGLLPSSCMWSERKEKIISNDYKPHYMYYYRLTNWSDKTRTGWTGSPSLPPSSLLKSHYLKNYKNILSLSNSNDLACIPYSHLINIKMIYF